MNDNSVSGDPTWSGGNLYLWRIHLAFLDSDKFGMYKDYDNQLRSLFTVHREIVAQMKETAEVNEVEQAEKLYKECLRIASFKKGDANLIVWKLYEYEKLLREVLKRCKMDIPRGQDTTKAIL